MQIALVLADHGLRLQVPLLVGWWWILWFRAKGTLERPTVRREPSRRRAGSNLFVSTQSSTRVAIAVIAGLLTGVASLLVPGCSNSVNAPPGYRARGPSGIERTTCPEATGCMTGCCRPLVP